jgi:endonuclease/exonuclease/phosphatase family metal-dependent hydrolase
MQPLRVMTFNIRYETPNDGPNNWPFRRDAAFAVVRNFAPHILGLQEAQAHMLDQFLAAFPAYRYIGIGRDDGVREGDFAAILYDPSRLSLQDSGTFWFSSTPDVPSRHPECFHVRICTWGFFHDSEGRDIAVYNLHLDHESQNARVEAVQQLIPTIDPERPPIIMGDFNAEETNPCIEDMRRAGYRDTFRVAHPDERQACTYHEYGRPDLADKIDYIWVDHRWKVEDAAIATGQVYGAWPSDHYPVTATLSE